ncbi:MAG: MFS transporter [Luteolibacter sp.]
MPICQSGAVRGREAQSGKPGRVFLVLWLVVFMQGMSPGLWLPALTNLLGARGWSAWVPLMFMVPPLCSMISPLLWGALADQRLAANRLFAWSALVGAVMLGCAFAVLDLGWNPWCFVGFLAAASLFNSPSWGLLATISLAHLGDGVRQFPRVRVGATFGWIAGGMLTSWVLQADATPLAGYAAAAVRLLCAVMAFALPHTPPPGRRPDHWWERLGLGAMGMLKQRDHLVFFTVTALFSVPFTAFYMYAPEQLVVMGDEQPTATMTVAQFTEVACMFLVGSVMTRFRVITVLAWSLGLAVIRYAMSAWAGLSGDVAWHVVGIALHGVCYTFYFITAQVFLDRRVELGMRAQAQGLLAMVSGGVGPLVGAALCGWLHIACVDSSGAGWESFWSILAGIIVVCWILLLSFYNGRKTVL